MVGGFIHGYDDRVKLIMKKRLQLINHKISLGLSLLLLLVNQIAAQAGTSSDKTKWLTNNLNKQKPDSAPISLKPLSAQEDCANKINSITVDYSSNSARCIKLRPFMANRKLPSRRDLELALTEQKAKMADEENARLNGQVSTFVVGENNFATKIERPTNTPINHINRTYTKHNIAKNAQNSFAFIKQAEQHLFSSPPIASQPIFNPQPSTNDIDTTNMASLSPASIQSEETGPSAFNLPLIGPNIQAVLPSSGFGSAGPPPFPLNLLPEATLKQLIKSLAGNNRCHNSGNTQAVAFGSWHNPYALNKVPSSYQHNALPYAGFQSHLTHRLYNGRINGNHIGALPAVTGSPLRLGRHQSTNQNNSNNPKDTAARNRMLLDSQLKVASYPVYATQSLKLWNFAQ
jgi:hypothetical protein